MSKIQFYPEIQDKNFQDIIYQKKEFYDNKIPKETRTYDEICKNTTLNFDLLPQQKFLKNLIAPNTPYNGCLIFWGTGIGKTCAAVSIAENFIPYLQKYNKRAIAIVGRNIRENFKNNIYNFDRKGQCTGKTYEIASDNKYLTKKQKVKNVRDFIASRYEFPGALEFANTVKSKIKDINGKDWDGIHTSLTDIMKKKIKKEYNGLLLIIDEVQNIGSGSSPDKENAIVPPIIRSVIEYGQNNKLVLMTATPMYDTANQIIYILNLLLLNDNRKPLNMDDIFEKDSILKKEGYEILKNALKGYISYVRENVYSFPYKIYPREVSKLIKRKFNLDGKIIKNNNQIKNIKVVECFMKSQQAKAYNSIFEKTVLHSIKNFNKKNTILSDSVSKRTRKDLTYISNIVYNNKNCEILYKSTNAFSNNHDGSSPFVKLFKKNKFTNKTKEQYQYQKHMIYNYGKKNEKPFLDEEHLWKYSTKLDKMLKIIKKSRGIIFIYTQYIPVGAIPIALMLEQNGYQPHAGVTLLDYRPSNAKKKPPQCYLCNNEPGNKIHSKGHPNFHEWKQARYIVFTGTLNKDNKDSIIQKIVNSSDNLYGSEIKIIIGTQVLSEGIDFKNIRQIHIFEPWYNMSRIQQVIGRGIRHCSHLLLPPEERNVEIFLYVASHSKKIEGEVNKYLEIETINERDYRMAEDKDIKIKRIERIMKESAIDCNLNIETNTAENKNKNKIISSSGFTYSTINEKKEFSRECDYMKECFYKCETPTPKKIKINIDTYDMSHEASNIYKIINVIKKIYLSNNIYKLSDIISLVKKEVTIDDIYIYHSLNNILTNKETILDKYNRKSYIINKGHYYILQPFEIPYTNIPMYYRDFPLTIKTTKIKIEPYMYEKKTETTNYKNKKENNKLYENVIEKTKNILKILKKNSIEINQNIINQLVIDKLDDENTVLLIKYIIENNIKNEYYSKYIVNGCNGFWYGQNIYMKYMKNGKWDNYERNDIRKIDIIKNKFKKIKKIKKKAPIIGQISNNNNKYIFKIIDRKKYTQRVTVLQQKSKRSFITGQFCGSYNKNELDNILNIIGLKNIKKDTKKNICILIEYKLRLLEKQNKNNNKWFYNRDEIINYKE
jgi:hypothetical protein